MPALPTLEKSKLIPWGIGLCCLFFLGVGCTPKPMELSAFTSDGCSLFMDGTFEQPELWKECCHLHDLAYWRGGTREEREQADLTFRNCVEKKTKNSHLALLMYQAVRAGGKPHFPTWYRWGYGWPLGRGYKALTPDEEKMVEARLREFRQRKKE
ncbi:MAG: hypothetical protein P8N49_04695 [Opitutales bacterium]|nr:hypothetical protein [Opitutales bacterium]